MGIKYLIGRIMRKIMRKTGVWLGMDELSQQNEAYGVLSAKVLINQMKQQGVVGKSKDVEFKVFSQFGDDGIIQFLIHHADIRANEDVFVEFGVENYEESNTRFLLINNNWRGLVIDGESDNIKHIQSRPYYWRHDLTAICAFINADNINNLIIESGISGDIGILSIDIDGNDYWVWEKINVVNPVIVIAEYNSTFGLEQAVTIPYDPTFRRELAHYSNLYWGASARALAHLAQKKGYVLVGGNSAGNNIYFVREDRLGSLRPAALEDVYVASKFREARNKDGSLSFLSGSARLGLIKDMPIYSVDRGEVVSLGDLRRGGE
jgi:hypothetical protein